MTWGECGADWNKPNIDDTAFWAELRLAMLERLKHCDLACYLPPIQKGMLKTVKTISAYTNCLTAIANSGKFFFLKGGHLDYSHYANIKSFLSTLSQPSRGLCTDPVNNEYGYLLF